MSAIFSACGLYRWRLDRRERALAVKAGAKEVTRRELGIMMRARLEKIYASSQR